MKRLTNVLVIATTKNIHRNENLLLYEVGYKIETIEDNNNKDTNYVWLTSALIQSILVRLAA